MLDRQLRRTVQHDEAWVIVAIVHPEGLPARHHLEVFSRFSLADRRVAKAIREIEKGWEERLGVRFFDPGDVKPYILLTSTEKPIRAYGKKFQAERFLDARHVYRYLEFLAGCWSRYGSETSTHVRAVVDRIRADEPEGVECLFARPASSEELPGGVPSSSPSKRERKCVRPDLTLPLVRRVGEALGFVLPDGTRTQPSPAQLKAQRQRAALRELAARILAKSYGQKSDAVLRNVVTPALQSAKYVGLLFDSSEKRLRIGKATRKRSRTALSASKNPKSLHRPKKS